MMKLYCILKCKNCGNEIFEIYEPDEDIIALKKCPTCGYKFQSHELERLRHILDTMCSLNLNCNLSIDKIYLNP